MLLQFEPCLIHTVALYLIGSAYAIQDDISCSIFDSRLLDGVPSGIEVTPESLYRKCSAQSAQPNLGCFCDFWGAMSCPEDFMEHFDCWMNCRCPHDDGQRSHENLLGAAEQALEETDPLNPIESSLLEEIINKSPEESAGHVAKTCSSTCTSVTRGCSTGCRCGARPVSLFFWLKASCGPMHSARASIAGHTGLKKDKRTLALPMTGPNSTLSGSQNSTMKTNSTTELYDDVQELIGSGALPAPCNASYVSYACANSSDGIVHEGPEMWLGALLPANVTSLPPVPKDWLLINGYPADHSSSNEWILTL